MYVLGETRLSEAGQRQMEVHLRDKGYKVAWGAPCCRKRFSSKIQPGGVAVLVRDQMRIQQVIPTDVDQHYWWEQGG